MIAVVIPSYKVTRHILDVIGRVGTECERIYVVDDCCPEGSGKLVEAECKDPRVRVIRHEQNQGVGGATLTGYRAAIADGADIIVKLDGDGQMDPALIPRLVQPIMSGEADYTKGNRFYDLEGLRPMPPMRLVGNAGLSFMTKLSSGYWNLFDPTNGLTAIHAKIARALPFEKLSTRWFFESDMLFRLGILRAAVHDVPMQAVYKDEESSLQIHRVLFVFAWKHIRNTIKRLFYSYYLRDFSVASIELLLGPSLLGFGLWVGIAHWIESGRTGQVASSGTVMLAALPILTGVQFVLAFLGYDVRNIPTHAIHRRL
jgi:glycosyltransferase involved in cell wall biosynthesis